MMNYRRLKMCIRVSLCVYTWILFSGSTVATASSINSRTFQDPAGQQPPEPQPIGVLELEPNNVDPGEARAITERFRFYLGLQPIFQVIERARMEDILEEVGFQIAGACDTEECIVQVGKILGARKMVAGSVSRVGTLYSLQARIVDIETSVVEYQAVMDVAGIEEVLQTACENVAIELAQQASGQPGVTRQRIDPGQPIILTTGQVRITSNPPEATITLDGEEIGNTPATLVLSEGIHVFLIEAEGYRPHTETIEVIGGDSKTVDVALRPIPSGFVDITTDPEGVTVLIDDVEVGETPLRRVRVFEGQRRIQFQREGYDSEVRNLVIAPDMTYSVTATLLRSGQAQLSLQSSLRGARVIINGERRSQTVPAQNITLRPGSYSVEVKAAGYSKWQQTINLADGENQTLTVVLRPKSRLGAGMLSLLIPGMGQFYSRRPVKGFLMLVSNAAVAGYAATLWLDRDTLQQEYAVLQSNYNSAASVDAVTDARTLLLAKHEEVQSNYDELKTMAMALGGLWVLNVLDAYALMPRLPSVGSVSPEINLSTNSGTLVLFLNLRF